MSWSPLLMTKWIAIRCKQLTLVARMEEIMITLKLQQLISESWSRCCTILLKKDKLRITILLLIVSILIRSWEKCMILRNNSGRSLLKENSKIFELRIQREWKRWLSNYKFCWKRKKLGSRNSTANWNKILTIKSSSKWKSKLLSKEIINLKNLLNHFKTNAIW